MGTIKDAPIGIAFAGLLQVSEKKPGRWIGFRLTETGTPMIPEEQYAAIVNGGV